MRLIDMQITPSLAGLLVTVPAQAHIVPFVESGNTQRRFQYPLPATLRAVAPDSAAWGCSAVRGAFMPPLMWEV